MPGYIAEIDANYADFVAEWNKSLSTAITGLSSNSKLQQSYRRLVSLNSWGADLLESVLDAESILFFKEAQNDALISHCMASCGSWRVALKSLRSLIENVMRCLYYKDHPVELSLWRIDKHRIAPYELRSYFAHHPYIEGFPESITGIKNIKAEYSTLSKAVHASSHNFRMTNKDASETIWNPSTININQWSTREREVISCINLLMIAIFHKYLQGASQSGLRKAISLTVGDSKRPLIKKYYKVNIPKRPTT